MSQVKTKRTNRQSAHQILLDLRRIFRKHEWVRGALFTREGAMCAMGGVCEAIGIDGLTEMQERIKVYKEWQQKVDGVRAGEEYFNWSREKREQIDELYANAPPDPDDLNEGKEDEILWLSRNDRSVARAVRYLAKAISLVDKNYPPFEEEGWNEGDPVRYIEGWNDDIPTRVTKKHPLIGKELLLKVIDKAIELEKVGK